MALNWGYLGQQAIVLGLAALVAVLALRGRALRAGWAGLLELPALAALQLLAGMSSRLGWGQVLPAEALGWTVAVGMAFWWVALLWPVRVLRQARTLRHSRLGKSTLVLVVLDLWITLWATLLEPQWLEQTRFELRFPEVGARPIRVAHVSDIQLVALGPRERASVEAVNAFEPHLVIISGDYIAGPQGEDVAVEAVRWMLARLRPSHGIWCTNSDSDDERQRQRIFKGLPVRYLLNESQVVEVEGVKVRVGGLNHLAPRYAPLRRGATPQELFLVACHSPDRVWDTRREVPECDLYLSGHTHGGQLQVPGFGPLLTFCWAPRQYAAGGLFFAPRGMPWIVSRGLGMEGSYAPRFRLNCRPQVILLTLCAAGETR